MPSFQKILAIETSCDDTSAAVLQNGTQVLGLYVHSQEIHKEYGGVIPEYAAREHAKVVDYACIQALEKAGIKMPDIDAIAVTYGPGLIGSLQSGILQAQMLSTAYQKPLIPVHHIRGHIASMFLEQTALPTFPYLVLTASGGHNELVYVKDWKNQYVLGVTRDDAAGEAFDKIAKIMGLAYPGGPSIQNAARSANPEAKKLLHVQDNLSGLDFSFSGFKTAFKRVWDNTPAHEQENHIPNLAHETEDFITRALIKRIYKAIEQYPQITQVHIAGGVSANAYLWEHLQKLPLPVKRPAQMLYCVDNAAMIGAAATFFENDIVNGNAVWNLEPSPNAIL